MRAINVVVTFILFLVTLGRGARTNGARVVNESECATVASELQLI